MRKEDSTGSGSDDGVRGDRGLQGHEMLMRRPLHSNYRYYAEYLTQETLLIDSFFFFPFLSDSNGNYNIIV